MFNYIFSTSSGYNTGLLFIIFFLIVVLISMVYYTNKDKNKLRNEINSLNKNINELKEENENKLDELNNEIIKKEDIPATQCPDCDCPENKECPKCPEMTCPTVDDIISGIFPGRNTGVTNSGRYFNVQGNESYELFPDYDFYQPSNAFPSDSILNAPDNILTGSINVPSNQINNTYNNDMLLTQNNNMIDSRMTRGFTGENTGPTTFGEGTERYGGDIASETNIADRAEAAALSDEEDPFNIQQTRDNTNYIQTNIDESTTTYTAEQREDIMRDLLNDQRGG